MVCGVGKLKQVEITYSRNEAFQVTAVIVAHVIGITQCQRADKVDSLAAVVTVVVIVSLNWCHTSQTDKWRRELVVGYRRKGSNLICGVHQRSQDIHDLRVRVWEEIGYQQRVRVQKSDSGKLKNFEKITKQFKLFFLHTSMGQIVFI